MIDLESKEKLVAECIKALPKQNWTLGPLSEQEKQLIGMAVRWTLEAVSGLAKVS